MSDVLLLASLVGSLTVLFGYVAWSGFRACWGNPFRRGVDRRRGGRYAHRR